MCQRFRNLRGLYNSQFYLAGTFLLTITLCCVGLIKTIAGSTYKPSLGINNESSLQYLEVVHIIDIIVQAIALLDLAFKSIEFFVHSKQKKIRHKRFLEMIEQSPASETGPENDSDFFQQYITVQDMRLDINRTAVLTDIFLTVVMIILIILELARVFDSPVAIMTRVYLKLPFLFCLCLHHIHLKSMSE